jgi:uncharacterized protein (DUF433 family)
MERNLLDRITTNPNILGGKPIIRGMRISVEQIVNALAGGVPTEDLLADIPVLEPEDLRACLAYAAQVVEEHSHFVMVA